MAALRGNFPWRCFNINYHIASIGKRTDSDETFMCTATAVLFSFNREYRFLIVWHRKKSAAEKNRCSRPFSWRFMK